MCIMLLLDKDSNGVFLGSSLNPISGTCKYFHLCDSGEIIVGKDLSLNLSVSRWDEVPILLMRFEIDPIDNQ